MRLETRILYSLRQKPHNGLGRAKRAKKILANQRPYPTSSWRIVSETVPRKRAVSWEPRGAAGISRGGAPWLVRIVAPIFTSKLSGTSSPDQKGHKCRLSQAVGLDRCTALNENFVLVVKSRIAVLGAQSEPKRHWLASQGLSPTRAGSRRYQRPRPWLAGARRSRCSSAR